LSWEHGEWTLTGLGMNVGENDTGDNYNFWGLEVGYYPRTTLGSGNYRLLVTGTSTAFPDSAGGSKSASSVMAYRSIRLSARPSVPFCAFLGSKRMPP